MLLFVSLYYLSRGPCKGVPHDSKKASSIEEICKGNLNRNSTARISDLAGRPAGQLSCSFLEASSVEASLLDASLSTYWHSP